MKLKERISASLRVLTTGTPYPLANKVKKPAIVLWPTWKEGQDAQWTMTDLSSYIDEGFNLNAIIYSSIMYKVFAASAAPLRAYIGDRDAKEPAPPNHPLTRLLDRPNTFQSFLELDGELRVYFSLFGNAYVYFRRGPDGFPIAMRSLRPDRVHHLYKDGAVAGFVYVPEGAAIADGIPMLAKDVMHVRLPNSGDSYTGMGKGMSPIAPLARSGDVDNAATAYLKQFFDYGAMPPGLLTFDVPMEESDVATARSRWMEIYGGSHNWQDIAVLDQGGKYERLGLTFAELDMKALDGRNEGRIAMCFGVPLTLIESQPALVQSTYSNKEQDRQMFWEDRMVPELKLFEVEWFYYLHGDDDAFPAYDYNLVPALQQSKSARVTRLMEAAKSGLATRADYREAEGLPVTDNDNVYLIPVSLILTPFDDMIDTSTQTQPVAISDHEEDRANAEDDDDQREEQDDKALKQKLSDVKKKAVGKRIDDTARSYEKPAENAARKAFEKDRREVRAIINQQVKSAREAKASIAWMNVLIPIIDYYRMSSKDNWRSEFAPVFEALVLAQGKQLNASFGMTFDVRNLLGEDWYRSAVLQFADPIAQTSMDEIRDLFSAAFQEGASVPEMERSLDLMFNQWANGGTTDAERERTLFSERRLPQYRRENIARTETIKMSNAGANALYKDWGVHKQEWLATNDARTRPSHLAANGQVVSVGGTFNVGGYQLRYPGDPTAPIAEIAQCRCTVLPVIEENVLTTVETGVPEQVEAPAAAQPIGRQILQAPVFNTVKEVEQWAKEHYADSVDLSAFTNIDYANEFNRTLQVLSDEYGVRIDRIYSFKNQPVYGNLMQTKGYTVVVLDENGSPTGERRMGADIGINTKFFTNFRDRKDLAEIMNAQFLENWSLSENVGDLITHEFGHVLSGETVNQMLPVSKYAMESPGETIAELFLKYKKFGNLTTQEMEILRNGLRVDL